MKRYEKIFERMIYFIDDYSNGINAIIYIITYFLICIIILNDYTSIPHDLNFLKKYLFGYSFGFVCLMTPTGFWG